MIDAPVILCIEDDELDYRAVVKVLPGYDVRWARTMAEGREMMHDADVVLCDLSLPDSSPEQTVSVLCEQRDNRCTMIITGNHSPQLARRAGQRGINYVPKTGGNKYLELFLQNALGVWEYRMESLQLLEAI